MLFVTDIIKLGHKIISAASCKITRTSGTAKSATTFSDGAVTVGTGKACIEHNFEYLGVHVFTHFVIPGMKTFISPKLRRSSVLKI
jgi:hypothetical protein